MSNKVVLRIWRFCCFSNVMFELLLGLLHLSGKKKQSQGHKLGNGSRSSLWNTFHQKETEFSFFMTCLILQLLTLLKKATRNLKEYVKTTTNAFRKCLQFIKWCNEVTSFTIIAVCLQHHRPGDCTRLKPSTCSTSMTIQLLIILVIICWNIVIFHLAEHLKTWPWTV